jgi:hypothetical protein
MAKRFNVAYPRPKYNSDESWWCRVGSARQNDNGLITIYLDSYPLPDKDGVVKMMLFEPDPARVKPAGAKTTPNNVHRLQEDLDDEIPF